ncbi:hypothetical protein [Thiomicrospira microaerophila]|uniref:hypothetical protein n=1 Tax=Thiomicrospira microaerophila TaxID=406020 RepID=UPI0005CA85C6|nr:hypothetical protein [Thiomicrospira microaerophila]
MKVDDFKGFGRALVENAELLTQLINDSQQPVDIEKPTSSLMLLENYQFLEKDTDSSYIGGFNLDALSDMLNEATDGSMRELTDVTQFLDTLDDYAKKSVIALSESDYELYHKMLKQIQHRCRRFERTITRIMVSIEQDVDNDFGQSKTMKQKNQQNGALLQRVKSHIERIEVMNYQMLAQLSDDLDIRKSIITYLYDPLEKINKYLGSLIKKLENNLSRLRQLDKKTRLLRDMYFKLKQGDIQIDVETLDLKSHPIYQLVGFNDQPSSIQFNGGVDYLNFSGYEASVFKDIANKLKQPARPIHKLKDEEMPIAYEAEHLWDEPASSIFIQQVELAKQLLIQSLWRHDQGAPLRIGKLWFDDETLQQTLHYQAWLAFSFNQLMVLNRALQKANRPGITLIFIEERLDNHAANTNVSDIEVYRL